MKSIINKIVAILLIVVFIEIIEIPNKIYAGFADFDDETADAQGRNDLLEQQEQDAQNAGKSSNNYLTELSVKGYELTPTFDKQTVNYSIEEEIDENSLEINAVADDERATVSGTGNVSLQTGENNLRIEVEAENGVKRTYFIKCNKKIEDEELTLSAITLLAVSTDGSTQEIFLNKQISNDVFEYSCDVYSDVNKIQIETTSEKSDANITITGNENLKEGQNTITIELKDDSGNETIYKIQVNKQYSRGNEAKAKENNSSIIFTIMAVIIIFIILIGFKRVNKSKKSRKH